MAKDSIIRHLTNSEDFIEQRKTARLDVPVEVRYKTLDEGPATTTSAGRRGTRHYDVGGQTRDEGQKAAVTKNLSTGGCLLLVPEELPMDSELELEILLGESPSEALKLRGRIVRLNRREEKIFEYGISFDAISKETRRLFADYFFAKMYEMIGLSEWPTDRRKSRNA